MNKKADNTTEISCDCCSSTDHYKVAQKRNFNIHKCSNCNIFFVCPQPGPAELEKLYDTSEGYFITANKSLNNTSPSKAIKLDKILTEYLPNRGKYLDIGCSSGKLIYHMRNLGWDVYGNDLNIGALDIAKNHNLKVTHGTLDTCGFEESYFDAIHLGDLIEHVPSPRALFNTIKVILKPGGIVTIVTPNSNSGFARLSLIASKLTGTSWPHSEAPHHLFDFDAKSIKTLLSSSGITVKDIKYKTGGGFAYMIGSTGYFDELKKSLKVNGKYQFNISLIPKVPQLILVTAWLLPIWIIGALSDKFNNSGKSMLVVGQRDNNS